MGEAFLAASTAVGLLAWGRAVQRRCTGSGGWPRGSKGCRGWGFLGNGGPNAVRLRQAQSDGKEGTEVMGAWYGAG